MFKRIGASESSSESGRRPPVSVRKLKKGLDVVNLSSLQKKETCEGLLFVGWVS